MLLYLNVVWYTSVYPPWKQKDRQFNNFVVTGGTISCRYDLLWYHQWWQCCQIDNIFFAVPQPAETCGKRPFANAAPTPWKPPSLHLLTLLDRTWNLPFFFKNTLMCSSLASLSALLVFIKNESITSTVDVFLHQKPHLVLWDTRVPYVHDNMFVLSMNATKQHPVIVQLVAAMEATLIPQQILSQDVLNHDNSNICLTTCLC